MKVLCKVVKLIINCRFTSSIAFHNILHGFRAGRGIGIDVVPVVVIWMVNYLHYLNYEDIPHMSSTCN